MTLSKIEWTDRSDWNAVRGCTRISEGCGSARGGGCYAEQIAARFSKPGLAFDGFATRKGGDGRWTGKVALIEDRLTLPLRWRRPAKIFANSMFDMFHESLAESDIDRLFAVMALAPQHIFQVVTKRADRMRRYFSDPGRYQAIHEAIWYAPEDIVGPLNPGSGVINRWKGKAEPATANVNALAATGALPNVWLGVSVEDQAAANARVPDLLATPAAVRFLSCEPLLGRLDLSSVGDADIHALAGWEWDGGVPTAKLDWVIVGGESGPRARPMNPAWALQLLDQCRAASVPFFFKQWGEWGFPQPPTRFPTDESFRRVESVRIDDKLFHGRRVHQFDDGWTVVRAGRTATGAILNSHTYTEFPA